MSARRTSSLLLWLYPARWRARYGAELEALLLETGGARVPWRVRADVARAAVRERLRGAGLAGDGPAERMRGGALLVLRAWAFFVVAGVAVRKLSEHWQAALPGGGRALPTAAFDVLVVAAAAGTLLILVGIAAVLPDTTRFVRGGGLRLVLRQVRAAILLASATVPAAVALVVWAHRLTPRERDGHDLAYGLAFALVALLLVSCLVAGTALAVAVARRLDLSRRVLRLEAMLAACVTAAMIVTTVATAVWCASASRVAPAPLAAAALMLLASTTAAGGATQALRGQRSEPSGSSR